MNPTRRLVDLNARLAGQWSKVGTHLLPFADAASAELPLSRLLRLSLFQVTVGMAAVLLLGTLNRVMIVELGVAAWLVAAMAALPVLFAPLRALVGFRSDVHRSALGWKRVPYLWFGTLMQFGGLAIMPFALIVLSGDSQGPTWIGPVGAALAFLLVGAGMQTTQTAGLALATDLAPAASRPRVVALMHVMLLLGMVGSALVFGWLLRDFSQLRLIRVVQGAALVTMVVNLTALWKQEPRRRRQPSDAPAAPRPTFAAQWARFAASGRSLRLLVAVGLGSAAFNMHEVILEPYGGEILKLPVGATTALTAMTAGGAVLAFALAARWLGRGMTAPKLAAYGALAGLAAFSCVIFAEPLASPSLFRVGATAIGFGGGLFAVGTLTAAMDLEHDGLTGLALGAWGAVQATCGGLAVFAGGALRDAIAALAAQGALGPALTGPGTGYSFVYHIELYLLFATLVAIGPLVRTSRASPARAPSPPRAFGIAELPH